MTLPAARFKYSMWKLFFVVWRLRPVTLVKVRGDSWLQPHHMMQNWLNQYTAIPLGPRTHQTQQSKVEIYQCKVSLQRHVLYTPDSCNGVWNTEMFVLTSQGQPFDKYIVQETDYLLWLHRKMIPNTIWNRCSGTQPNRRSLRVKPTFVHI